MNKNKLLSKILFWSALVMWSTAIFTSFLPLPPHKSDVTGNYIADNILLPIGCTSMVIMMAAAIIQYLVPKDL